MSLKNPVQRYVIRDKNGVIFDAFIGTKNAKAVKRAKKSSYNIQTVDSFAEPELRVIFKDVISDTPTRENIEKFSREFDANTNKYSPDEIELIQQITKITSEDAFYSNYMISKLMLTHIMFRGDIETFEEYVEYSKEMFDKSLMDKGIRLTIR